MHGLLSSPHKQQNPCINIKSSPFGLCHQKKQKWVLFTILQTFALLRAPEPEGDQCRCVCIYLCVSNLVFLIYFPLIHIEVKFFFFLSQTVEIKVKMDCDGCERRVKNAVKYMEGTSLASSFTI